MSLGPRNQKKPRKLNPDELKMLENFSGVRLPMDQCAQLLGMSKDTLERMYKKDAAVRAAIDGGRSKASSNVRRTLYTLAMGKPAVYETIKETHLDRDGKPYVKEYKSRLEQAIEPEFQALKFWCQTQEGFKTADKLELVGKDDSKLAGIVVQIVEPKPEND